MTDFLDIAFCYEPEAVSGADVAYIFDETRFFEPTHVRTDVFCRVGCRFKPDHLRRIAKEPYLREIELATDEGLDRGPCLYRTEIEAMQCLYLNVSGEKAIPLDFLNDLACRKGFRAGYCHSTEDTTWQGEIQVERYVSQNRPHEHLPKIWDYDLNEFTIDISGNPARRELISKMWLQPDDDS